MRKSKRADGQAQQAQDRVDLRRRPRGLAQGSAVKRAQVGIRVALLALDPLSRYLLREGLRRRGHEVTAVGDVHELLRAAQVQRFAVALLLVPPGAAPLLLRQVRGLDPNLEVLWAAPPLRVSEAESLITQAAERAQQRKDELLASLRAGRAPAQAPAPDAEGPASFAQLAGMLAHELNNPLTLVLANLSCLRETLEELHGQLDADSGRKSCDEALEVLTEIHCGAARIREVVRELTTIGKPRSQLVAIDEIVRAVMGIGERALQRRARVVVEIAPRLPRVRGTAGSLAQLLLNLLLNAVQAMPTESPARAPRVVLRAEALQVGGRALVALRVSDNGPGIAADALPRLFEAGFTTKAQGSGLGLAICRQIAEAHGGEITVESQLGRGTTMSVLLPAAVARSPRREPSAARLDAGPSARP